MLKTSLVCAVLLGLPAVAACRPKTDPSAGATPDAEAAPSAVAPARPALPPEPAPPVADKAGEVPDLEAKVAADKAYAAVWMGPRADLNAFLSYVSELLATGGAPTPLASAVKAKKLQDPAISSS